MKTLEEKLGYTFQDPALLENALTHSSRANESRGKLASNERLEFLGDSILGMAVADHLYRNHPDLPEGDLTRTRAALVCEESLVEVAQALVIMATWGHMPIKIPTAPLLCCSSPSFLAMASAMGAKMVILA